jgi:hypothetical protein
MGQAEGHKIAAQDGPRRCAHGPGIDRRAGDQGDLRDRPPGQQPDRQHDPIGFPELARARGAPSPLAPSATEAFSGSTLISGQSALPACHASLNIGHLLLAAETGIFLEQTGERRIAIDELGAWGLSSSRSQ